MPTRAGGQNVDAFGGKSSGDRRSKLKPELSQVVVADFQVVEGRFGLVVFYEVVLDAGFAGRREDALEIDFALAGVDEVAGLGVGTGGAFVIVTTRSFRRPIFHMHEREAARITIEIFQRIVTADGDPAKVHFHFDELGIRFGEEKIVRRRSHICSAESDRFIAFETVRTDFNLLSKSARVAADNYMRRTVRNVRCHR